MPNIKSKGTIPKRIVRVPRPPLISNIASVSKTSASSKVKTGDAITTAITSMSNGQQATPKHEIGDPENGKLSISIYLPELVSSIMFRKTSL